MPTPRYETELAAISRREAEAQTEVEALRAQREARLLYWQQQGVAIAALARASGLARQVVYQSIERARAATRAGRFVWRDGDLVVLKPGEPTPPPRRRRVPQRTKPTAAE